MTRGAGAILVSLFALVAAPVRSDEAKVHRVSLVVPAASTARLMRYVTVHEGEPWDRALARSTATLLMGTGEFEDVSVDAQPGPDGVEVTIRPAPSPRLLDVKIEGDAVRSARDLKHLARLHDGEPLWPNRLDEASRAVSQALVQSGYLEAQVTATALPLDDPFAGANLVFHIRSGPRARVSSVALEGVEGAELALLLHLVAPRVGQAYEATRAEKAQQAMRRRLVRAGHWRASVEARAPYDPSTASVALVFAVTPGPITRAEIQGAVFPKGLEGDVEVLLRDGGLGRDAEEQASERLEEALRARGHRDARVRVKEEERPFGLAVVFEAQPGPEARVMGVRVEGSMDEIPTLLVRGGEPFEERKLDEDVRALTRTLEDSGHAEASVEPVVPEGGGDLAVAYRVNAGPRTTIAAITVDSPVSLPPPQTRQELRSRVGAPYRVRDLAADRNTIVSAYRDGGYLDVEVVPEVVLSDDHTEARITLRVAPGPRTDVGRLVVAGLRHTREEVVRRELKLEEGQPLGLGRLVESQKQLGSLGIFDRVGISNLDPELPSPQDIVVETDEAARTTFSYGVGYSELDRLRGSIEVSRRNLGGLDRTLTIYTRGSFGGSRFLVGYREPYLFGHRRDLYVAAFREQEEGTGFDFIRTGVQAQTVARLGRRTSVSLRYSYQDTRVFALAVPLDEVDRQYRTYTLSGPSVSFVSDGRDDSLDPHRGSFLGADVQSSFRVMGGASFVKGFFQAATYRRLHSRLTLALAARLGLARTFGTTEPLALPLPERFFAGGDYGPRGFQTDYAGPLNVSSTGQLIPTGGNALVFAGLELRYDLRRSLALAVFTDSGGAYGLVSDIDLAGMFYTTGVGLHYKTPVGPIRVDWGYKLNRRPGESPYHFHITIGNAF